MPRLCNLAALLAVVGPALTNAALSDGQYTETIGPQELGSTTIDGTMIYSVNHCSIVHSTQCHTSLSTGGVPPAPTGSAPPSELPTPSYGGSDTSSSSSSSSSSVPAAPTSTNTESTATPGPEESATTTTTTTAEEEAATSTSKIPDVPTGAAVVGAPVVIIANVLVAAAVAAAVAV